VKWGAFHNHQLLQIAPNREARPAAAAVRLRLGARGGARLMVGLAAEGEVASTQRMLLTREVLEERPIVAPQRVAAVPLVLLMDRVAPVAWLPER